MPIPTELYTALANEGRFMDLAKLGFEGKLDSEDIAKIWIGICVNAEKTDPMEMIGFAIHIGNLDQDQSIRRAYEDLFMIHSYPDDPKLIGALSRTEDLLFQGYIPNMVEYRERAKNCLVRALRDSPHKILIIRMLANFNDPSVKDFLNIVRVCEPHLAQNIDETLETMEPRTIWIRAIDNREKLREVFSSSELCLVVESIYDSIEKLLVPSPKIIGTHSEIVNINSLFLKSDVIKMFGHEEKCILERDILSTLRFAIENGDYDVKKKCTEIEKKIRPINESLVPPSEAQIRESFTREITGVRQRSTLLSFVNKRISG